MIQANLFKCVRNGFLASCLMLPLAVPAIAQSGSGTSNSANSGQSSGTGSMQGAGNGQTNTAPGSGQQSGTPEGVVPGTSGTGTYPGPYASSTPVNEPTTPANT